VINVREGLRAADDILPRRLSEEALTEGALAGQTVDFDLMRAEFYQASGLDPTTSLPLPATLARLGLEWVVEDPLVADIMKQGAP
ncbi:MAG: aldehyde ferredoxin oxidoreductase C-terminal domain-containing protein, partial [Actinomycetes bacterium]